MQRNLSHLNTLSYSLLFLFIWHSHLSVVVNVQKYNKLVNTFTSVWVIFAKVATNDYYNYAVLRLFAKVGIIIIID